MVATRFGLLRYNFEKVSLRDPFWDAIVNEFLRARAEDILVERRGVSSFVLEVYDVLLPLFGDVPDFGCGWFFDAHFKF